MDNHIEDAINERILKQVGKAHKIYTRTLPCYSEGPKDDINSLAYIMFSCIDILEKENPNMYSYATNMAYIEQAQQQVRNFACHAKTEFNQHQHNRVEFDTLASRSYLERMTQHAKKLVDQVAKLGLFGEHDDLEYCHGRTLLHETIETMATQLCEIYDGIDFYNE